MKIKHLTFIVWLTAISWGCTEKENIETEVLFSIPANFPKPTYDLTKNPVTKTGFELGKALFYDKSLSRDGSVSCASCHLQSAAFTDLKTFSRGIENRVGSRNAPPIQNMAWMNLFFWDGGVFELDLFPIAPIQNELEMDETVANVLKKLNQNDSYRKQFKKAFGSDEITSLNLFRALSQFQLALVSANSRYDKYIRGETGGTLSAGELEGLALFKQKCSSCHAGELFTDQSFRNNGLKIMSENEMETGRFRVNLNEADKYKFRVPSLRNIAFTAPYMHDGRFETLADVMNHYAENVNDTPNLDHLLKNNGKLGIELTSSEKQKLIAFLNTLSDDSFISDKRFSE